MFDQSATSFADVILPLALSQAYTYAVPKRLEGKLKPGQRVTVQFGKKKIYTALIHKIHENEPELHKPKPLLDVLDPGPIVDEQQRQLWEWMSDYYLCTLGEVMDAALPAALKLKSETKIILSPDFDDDFTDLDEKEFLVAEALTIRNELAIEEVQLLLEQKEVYHVIRSLLEKRVLYLREELQEKFSPKTEDFLSLNDEYQDKQERQQLFQELERAPKQLEALMHFFQLSKKGKEVSRTDLNEATNKNYAGIKALLDKDILVKQQKRVSRLHQEEKEINAEYELTEVQQQAFNEIEGQFEKHDVVLLHGVTGSGKTEIYADLIKKILEQQGQVLYLLPEIALTGQLVTRLRKIFGNKIGIYHSRFSSNERVEIWEKISSGEYQILLGVRSSVFLPFKNLQLIVVDEEHDHSYKQFDPAPRYHARDTAIFLGKLHRAKVLLGSATPSIDSYFNADLKKYGLVKLLTRFGDISLPHIKVVDVTRSAKMAHFKSHFTEDLLNDTKRVLEQKEQVILFRNRRGYSPMLMCGTCGHTPQCDNCDVSLTYHKGIKEMKCHYCGSRKKMVTTCPACGAHHMQVVGFGTEKIEDELSIIMPEARIARMDYDAVRSKYGHEKIIADFEKGKIDVLVGTQMVTKGLDFEKVALVGILNSDQLLNYPDFRAHERAFQLMVQVSGRAGRKHKQGEVLIQARDVHHPILRMVVQQDYEHFYFTELKERKIFKYPPYVRLISLHLRHKKREIVSEAANAVYRHLSRKWRGRILPPAVPTVGRVKNQYLINIMIKIERKKGVLHDVKNDVQQLLKQIKASKNFRSVHIHADVDPY